MKKDKCASAPSAPRLGKRARPRSRGQAITEFALVLPIAILVLAVAATGGQMLVAGIDLTQAARAGAVSAQAAYDGGTYPAELPDAITAAQQEMGVSSLTCTSGGGVPASCAQVTNSTDPNSGQSLVKVNLWETIDPFVPLFAHGLTIKVEATAGG